jgi:adenine-specific DNA-methyltransferase
LLLQKPASTVSPFDDACAKVSKLGATFKANEARYLSSNYQEAEARKDFIDKFFIALGWDVNHDSQTNPYEQEVKVEPSVSAGGQRRADYAFHLAPNYRDVRFFVEAKKPHGDLSTADNYFQTIRYGWNTETPLAVLTDFNQFHILDCRYKPDIATALHRRVAKYYYTEYLDRTKFAEIYWLFSREAVADGSLEKRANNLPKPRGKAVQQGLFPGGYQNIDGLFLQELDEYRVDLARAFKKTDPTLDSETLTELVQRTLDRLVFLRFLEDKGVEPHRIVHRFGDKGTAWEDFIAASRRLDGIYNGAVFKKHAILDNAEFQVDDTPFANICESLAHFNSPYDFNAIPIHILGSVYERFLGNVIVATQKRVSVEPKPEVRKAGGVYYTPEYIVRYIVDNTVGKIIADKTPDQIAEMRFADISCGSGSFLLGIFEILLTHHGRFYNENPKKARKGDCIKQNGQLYLSLRKKREILLNNIFGVDIDAQAVEVCQLSLYLRLLKDETTASAHQYLLEFEHVSLMKKLLPDLSKNIQCGNSLIGRDILDGQFFPSDEERKLNPLDFKDAFPAVMKRGGFDAIVGNPPYVNAWDFYENQPTARQFINDGSHYTTADRHWDLYVLFLERAYQLTKKGGWFSFIIPFSYAIQKYAILSRRLLLQECSIDSIADIRTVRVFGSVPVITIIPVVKRAKPNASAGVNILRPTSDPAKAQFIPFQLHHQIPQKALLDQHESMFRLDLSRQSVHLLEKLERKSIKLGDVCYVNYGAQMFSKIKGQFGKEHVIRDTKEGDDCRKMISGRELYRYSIEWAGRYVDWSFSSQMYGPRWPEFFEVAKIMIRDITGTHRVEATYDDTGYYCDHTVLCALRKADVAKWKPVSELEAHRSKQFDIRFLAGVVASSCTSRYFYLVLTGEGERTGGGFHTYPETIRNFPIPNLDISNRADKAHHDQIVQKVQAMLDTRKEFARVKTDKDRAYCENKCAALDRQIDRLVYDLYEMTDSEIQILEQTS